MELDLSLSPDLILKNAKFIAEACGYSVWTSPNELEAHGNDGEHSRVLFTDDGKVKDIIVWQTFDNGEYITKPHSIPMGFYPGS